MSSLTEKEARDRILEAVRDAADYAIDRAPPQYDLEERITLAMFCLLSDLDGCSSDAPVDFLVLECDDETGDVIGETRVSTMMHEFLYEDGRTDRWGRGVLSKGRHAAS